MTLPEPPAEPATPGSAEGGQDAAMRSTTGGRPAEAGQGGALAARDQQQQQHQTSLEDALSVDSVFACLGALDQQMRLRWGGGGREASHTYARLGALPSTGGADCSTQPSAYGTPGRRTQLASHESLASPLPLRPGQATPPGPNSRGAVAGRRTPGSGGSVFARHAARYVPLETLSAALDDPVGAGDDAPPPPPPADGPLVAPFSSTGNWRSTIVVTPPATLTADVVANGLCLAMRGAQGCDANDVCSWLRHVRDGKHWDAVKKSYARRHGDHRGGRLAVALQRELTKAEYTRAKRVLYERGIDPGFASANTSTAGALYDASQGDDGASRRGAYDIAVAIDAALQQCPPHAHAVHLMLDADVMAPDQWETVVETFRIVCYATCEGDLLRAFLEVLPSDASRMCTTILQAKGIIPSTTAGTSGTPTPVPNACARKELSTHTLVGDCMEPPPTPQGLPAGLVADGLHRELVGVRAAEDLVYGAGVWGQSGGSGRVGGGLSVSPSRGGGPPCVGDRRGGDPSVGVEIVCRYMSAVHGPRQWREVLQEYAERHPAHYGGCLIAALRNELSGCDVHRCAMVLRTHGVPAGGRIMYEPPCAVPPARIAGSLFAILHKPDGGGGAAADEAAILHNMSLIPSEEVYEWVDKGYQRRVAALLAPDAHGGNGSRQRKSSQTSEDGHTPWLASPTSQYEVGTSTDLAASLTRVLTAREVVKCETLLRMNNIRMVSAPAHGAAGKRDPSSFSVVSTGLPRGEWGEAAAAATPTPATPLQPLPAPLPAHVADALYQVLQDLDANGYADERRLFALLEDVRDAEHWRRLTAVYHRAYQGGIAEGDIHHAIHEVLTADALGRAELLLEHKGVDLYARSDGFTAAGAVPVADALRQALDAEMDKKGTATACDVLAAVPHAFLWRSVVQVFKLRHSDFHHGCVITALKASLTARELARCEGLLREQGANLHGPEHHMQREGRGNRTRNVTLASTAAPGTPLTMGDPASPAGMEATQKSAYDRVADAIAKLSFNDCTMLESEGTEGVRSPLWRQGETPQGSPAGYGYGAPSTGYGGSPATAGGGAGSTRREFPSRGPATERMARRLYLAMQDGPSRDGGSDPRYPPGSDDDDNDGRDISVFQQLAQIVDADQWRGIKAAFAALYPEASSGSISHALHDGLTRPEYETCRQILSSKGIALGEDAMPAGELAGEIHRALRGSIAADVSDVVRRLHAITTQQLFDDVATEFAKNFPAFCRGQLPAALRSALGRRGFEVERTAMLGTCNVYLTPRHEVIADALHVAVTLHARNVATATAITTEAIGQVTSRAEWDAVVCAYERAYPMSCGGDVIAALRRALTAEELQAACVGVLAAAGVEFIPQSRVIADALYVAVKGGQGAGAIKALLREVRCAEDWEAASAWFKNQYESAFCRGEVVAALRRGLDRTELDVCCDTLLLVGVELIPRAERLAEGLLAAMRGGTTLPEEDSLPEVVRQIRDTRDWGDVSRVFKELFPHCCQGDLSTALYEELGSADFNACRNLLRLVGVEVAPPKQHKDIAVAMHTAIEGGPFHRPDPRAACGTLRHVRSPRDWAVTKACYKQAFPTSHDGDLVRALAHVFTGADFEACRAVLSDNGVALTPHTSAAGHIAEALYVAVTGLQPDVTGIKTALHQVTNEAMWQDVQRVFEATYPQLQTAHGDGGAGVLLTALTSELTDTALLECREILMGNGVHLACDAHRTATMLHHAIKSAGNVVAELWDVDSPGMWLAVQAAFQRTFPNTCRGDLLTFINVELVGDAIVACTEVLHGHGVQMFPPPSTAEHAADMMYVALHPNERWQECIAGSTASSPVSAPTPPSSPAVRNIIADIDGPKQWVDIVTAFAAAYPQCANGDLVDAMVDALPRGELKACEAMLADRAVNLAQAYPVEVSWEETYGLVHRHRGSSSATPPAGGAGGADNLHGRASPEGSDRRGSAASHTIALGDSPTRRHSDAADPRRLASALYRAIHGLGAGEALLATTLRRVDSPVAWQRVAHAFEYQYLTCAFGDVDRALAEGLAAVQYEECQRTLALVGVAIVEPGKSKEGQPTPLDVALVPPTAAPAFIARGLQRTLGDIAAGSAAGSFGQGTTDDGGDCSMAVRRPSKLQADVDRVHALLRAVASLAMWHDVTAEYRAAVPGVRVIAGDADASMQLCGDLRRDISDVLDATAASECERVLTANGVVWGELNGSLGTCVRTAERVHSALRDGIESRRDEAELYQALAAVPDAAAWRQCAAAFRSTHPTFYDGDIAAAMAARLTSAEFTTCEAVLAHRNITLAADAAPAGHSGDAALARGLGSPSHRHRRRTARSPLREAPRYTAPSEADRRVDVYRSAQRCAVASESPVRARVRVVEPKDASHEQRGTAGVGEPTVKSVTDALAALDERLWRFGGGGVEAAGVPQSPSRRSAPQSPMSPRTPRTPRTPRCPKSPASARSASTRSEASQMLALAAAANERSSVVPASRAHHHTSLGNRFSSIWEGAKLSSASPLSSPRRTHAQSHTAHVHMPGPGAARPATWPAAQT